MLYILVLLTLSASVLNYFFTFNFNLAILLLFFFTASYFFLKKKRTLYFVYFVFLIALFSANSFNERFELDSVYNFKIKKDGDRIYLINVNGKSIKDKVYLNIENFYLENGFYTLKGEVTDINEKAYYTSLDLNCIDVKVSMINRIKNAVRERIYRLTYMQSRSLYGFLTASIIGEKSETDIEIVRTFREIGIAHILVISGLHIAFFIMMAMKLFEILNFRYKTKYISVLILLTIYCLTVGMGASVLRAYIMGVVYIVAKIMFEESELKKSLCLAFIIAQLLDPYAMFSLSFQLSYGAVLAIIVLYPKLKRKNFIYNMFALSFSIQVFLMPLSIYYFNKIAILTFLSNIVIAPIASILIQLSMISLIVSSILPFLNTYLGSVLNFIWEVVTFYGNLFLKIPFMNIELYKTFNGFYVIFTYLLLFLLLYAKKIGVKYRMLRADR